MKPILLLIAASIGALGAPCSGANGYTYCQTLVLDHTKVPSNQSNYPAGICFGVGMGPHCLTNSKQLATAANGGFLQDTTNGFDFILTSDSGGTMPLTYEASIHNLTTGESELWVLLPSISSTVDLTIYLFYGNASVTTDQSNAAGVWDANYLAVHHFQVQPPNQYTTIVDANDSTGQNQLAISQNPTTVLIDSLVGVVGGAANLFATGAAFVNQGPYTNFPPTGSPAPFTLEGWFDNRGFPAGVSYCIGGNNNPNGDRWAIFWTSTIWEIEGNGVGVTFPDGATSGWHRIVTILPSGQTTFINGKVYVDGVSQTLTNAVAGTTTVAPRYSDPNGYAAGALCGFGPATFARFGGYIDEVRLSKIERSQDWITTDYNNQSNVATFWSNSTTSNGGAKGKTIIIN